MELVGDATKARFIATFFDNLIAIFLSFAAVSLVPERLPIMKGIVLIFVYLGYFVLFEALWSRTLGKYFQGLVVRKLDGSLCDWKAALLRSGTRVLEVNPVLFGGIPAGLFVISTERKQRLGDLLAGTLVVSDKQDLTTEN
jgi:uncharacterized RDD family membrane protein YckC